MNASNNRNMNTPALDPLNYTFDDHMATGFKSLQTMYHNKNECDKGEDILKELRG